MDPPQIFSTDHAINATEITIINELEMPIIVRTRYHSENRKFFFIISRDNVKNQKPRGAQRLQHDQRLSFDCRNDDIYEMTFGNLGKKVSLTTATHKNIYCLLLRKAYEN